MLVHSDHAPRAARPLVPRLPGLSVARQLARLLGGDVFVTRSVIGEGSTFVVSLPARYAGGAAGVRNDSAVHLFTRDEPVSSQHAGLAPSGCHSPSLARSCTRHSLPRFPRCGACDVSA